ncbi:hypothetical protein [Georgenia muralis]
MGRSRWRLAAYAGLIALLALNAVLIGRLFGLFGSDAEPAPAEDLGGTTTTPSSSVPTEDPVPVPSRDPSPRASRILAAASDVEAWRTEGGRCGTPPLVERTLDAGRTWTFVGLDLGPVTRIRITGDGPVAVIGGDADCAPRYVTSADGEVWEDRSDLLAGSWYLMPINPSRMMTPLGEADTPCAGGAATLDGLDVPRALIRCTDGSVQRTDDAGASWAPVTTDGPAVAVSTDVKGYVIATRSAACEGIAVASMAPEAEAVGAASGCATAVEADGVAVARAGTAVWLWVGTELLISLDGGLTW